jgi:hypothetical protein
MLGQRSAAERPPKPGREVQGAGEARQQQRLLRLLQRMCLCLQSAMLMSKCLTSSSSSSSSSAARLLRITLTQQSLQEQQQQQQ